MYINYFLIKLKSEKINFKIKKQKIGLESFRSAPWEAFCLQGLLTPILNTNLPSEVSVFPQFLCAKFKVSEMVHRSVPNLNPVKLPSPFSYTRTLLHLRYAESFVVISVHHLCPRCSFWLPGKPPNPLRGDRSINFSRLNPNQGVHLSTSSERLFFWTLDLLSLPWSLAQPGIFYQAPQWAILP